MIWNRNLSNLRNVLAGLYGTVEEARIVIVDVGLNPAYIAWHNRPITLWQGILEEADKHQAIPAIISRAREQYPRIQSLQLAEHNLLVVVESPQIPEESWQGPQDVDKLEKILGKVSSLRPISFLEQGLLMSKAVARIALVDGSKGSGFLIKGNLLVTNHHVLSSESVAESAIAEFNYQKTIAGTEAQAESFQLIPAEGFLTSPEIKHGGDDWTVVRVRGEPNQRWGALTLTRVEPKVEDEVIIVQHPGGGQKQIALSHNFVTSVNERRIQYLTDTLEGSSGAPVCNAEWQVVAVHHAGGWLRDPVSSRAVYRNQGVHINRVIDALEASGL